MNKSLAQSNKLEGRCLSYEEAGTHLEGTSARDLKIFFWSNPAIIIYGLASSWSRRWCRPSAQKRKRRSPRHPRNRRFLSLGPTPCRIVMRSNDLPTIRHPGDPSSTA